jgi:hypothetical protein
MHLIHNIAVAVAEKIPIIKNSFELAKEIKTEFGNKNSNEKLHKECLNLGVKQLCLNG